MKIDEHTSETLKTAFLGVQVRDLSSDQRLVYEEECERVEKLCRLQGVAPADIASGMLRGAWWMGMVGCVRAGSRGPTPDRLSFRVRALAEHPLAAGKVKPHHH